MLDDLEARTDSFWPIYSRCNDRSYIQPNCPNEFWGKKLIPRKVKSNTDLMASEEHSVSLKYRMISGKWNQSKMQRLRWENSDKYLTTKCASVNRYKKYLTIFIVINDDTFAICRLNFNSIRRQPYSRGKDVSPPRRRKGAMLSRDLRFLGLPRATLQWLTLWRCNYPRKRSSKSDILANNQNLNERLLLRKTSLFTFAWR